MSDFKPANKFNDRNVRAIRYDEDKFPKGIKEKPGIKSLMRGNEILITVVLANTSVAINVYVYYSRYKQ